MNHILHLVSGNGKAFGLIGITAVLLICLQIDSNSSPQPVHFNNLREFKDFALAKGLSFPEQPIFMSSLFIADHPLSVVAMSKLRSMDKRDCGLTPAWRGLLWVSALQSRFDSRVAPPTIGGKSRIWGGLLVAGDEELMNRIEQLVRAE